MKNAILHNEKMQTHNNQRALLQSAINLAKNETFCDLILGVQENLHHSYSIPRSKLYIYDQWKNVLFGYDSERNLCEFNAD